MIARAAISLAALTGFALATAPARGCTLRFDEPEAYPEVELIGFVTRSETFDGRYSAGFSFPGRLLQVETIRTVRGERRPNWLVVVRDLPFKGWRPLVFGDGPYRLAFDLPETRAPNAEPSSAPEARLSASGPLLPVILNGPCGLPPVSPVSPYSPDVLLARAVGASAAPFVAGLSGLALLAGAGALLRRRWRRA